MGRLRVFFRVLREDHVKPHRNLVMVLPCVPPAPDCPSWTLPTPYIAFLWMFATSMGAVRYEAGRDVEAGLRRERVEWVAGGGQDWGGV